LLELLLLDEAWLDPMLLLEVLLLLEEALEFCPGG
jgi:hypothetical protein